MLIIFAFVFGDDEKHATETNTKGVVGQTGKNTPMRPSPKNMYPKVVSSINFIRNLSKLTNYN